MEPKINNQLGTDKVDPVVEFFGRLITALVGIDTDKDNKVEGSEILMFAQNVGFDAFATFQNFSLAEFKAQVKDLDATERAKEIEILAAQFKIDVNPEAEWLIEDWLRFANDASILIERTKQVFKKAA